MKKLILALVFSLTLPAFAGDQLYVIIFQDNIPVSEQIRMGTLLSENMGQALNLENELKYATHLTKDSALDETWKCFVLQLPQVTGNGFLIDSSRLALIQGSLTATQLVQVITSDFDAAILANGFSQATTDEEL